MELNEQTLPHQEDQDRFDLQQENNRLKLLQRIALLTAGNRDRTVLHEALLLELQQAFAVDGCGIYQLQQLDSPLHLISQLGIPAELGRELQKVPAGKGLASQVIASGVPHNWVDLRAEPLLHCRAVLDAGWRSLLSLPLTAHDRMVGVMFLFQRLPRQFSQQDTELLEQIGQLLAAAIDNTDLLEKLEWQHRLTQASQRELERSRQQLREHLTRLEESNRALEQLGRMKDRFLALASHELRTPLTCILAAAELLEGQLSRIPPDSQALLTTILQGGQRLNALVEDLLEMARIESRDIYLARESIDLPALLQELVQQFRSQATEQQLSLELGPVPDLLSPLGDRFHLQRALSRLLKNALKFTPAGGRIQLEAIYRSSREILERRQQLEPFCPTFFQPGTLPDQVELRIIDSGIGISEHDRLRIFDKFHGAGDISLHGRPRQTIPIGPSAGLGLPLAKGMIEAHGGMVWVESAGDQQSGSIFHVLLPLLQRHPKAAGDD